MPGKLPKKALQMFSGSGTSSAPDIAPGSEYDSYFWDCMTAIHQAAQKLIRDHLTAINGKG
jgi:hypothetical protein